MSYYTAYVGSMLQEGDSLVIRRVPSGIEARLELANGRYMTAVSDGIENDCEQLFEFLNGEFVDCGFLTAQGWLRLNDAKFIKRIPLMRREGTVSVYIQRIEQRIEGRLPGVAWQASADCGTCIVELATRESVTAITDEICEQMCDQDSALGRILYARYPSIDTTNKE